MYNTIKNIGWVVCALSVSLVSCDEDLPKAQDLEGTSGIYDTEIHAIRITNAGAEGNKVVEGSIDEESKTINFPRLDVQTNFSALAFEADLSKGAVLKEPVMDFTMDEETAEKTSILRIVNNNRYKEYFVKIRKRMPVFGADFEQPTVYNFSGDQIYADFSDAGSTRCASYDGEHVLVVSRATKPHLLKVSDLKQGKINKIELNLTGVSGGTFPYNMGSIVKGRVYLSTLSGAPASPFKIYYWDNPTDVSKAPVVAANINVATIEGTGARHGDNASYNIDEDGNGYIFFGDNKATSFMRVPVSNYETIDQSQIRIFPSRSDATMVTNVCRIGNTDKYLWGGVRVPVTLVDEGVSPIYQSSIAGEAVSPKVVEFNKERYLVVCTAGFGGASKASIALEVYNITKGATIEEALQNFDEGENHNPVYQFKLGGSGNANALAQTDFYIEKDEQGNDVKLCLFAARTGSGFLICEFPIKKEED